MTTTTHRARSIGEGVVAIVVVICLCVGLYAGYWWLRRDVLNRGADIRRNGFEQQTTFRDQMTQKMADVAQVDAQLANPDLPADQRAALNAQRAAIVTETCRIATHLAGDVDTSIATFRTANCP